MLKICRDNPAIVAVLGFDAVLLVAAGVLTLNSDAQRQGNPVQVTHSSSVTSQPPAPDGDVFEASALEQNATAHGQATKVVSESASYRSAKFQTTSKQQQQQALKHGDNDAPPVPSVEATDTSKPQSIAMSSLRGFDPEFTKACPSQGTAPSLNCNGYSQTSSATPIYGRSVSTAVRYVAPDGNSLEHLGMAMTVVGTASSSTGSVVPDLVVDLQDVRTPAQKRLAAATPLGSTQQALESPSALTPADELFRTKWGWQAFDAARTAARQAAEAGSRK